MNVRKEARLSYWAHHLTTIISVTLVLLLMGIIALTWISADAEIRRIKERVELSVILRDSVPEGAGRRLADEIKAAPYSRDVRLITREEALENWTRETGENLNEVFGVNPLSEEISFSLDARYASTDSIAAISKTLAANPAVEDVAKPDATMIETMNRNLGYLTLILGIIAIVMALISFVLINNTVHLTIHSRRFLIHTMQLVGATNGFILRPIILNQVLAGLLAGLTADAIIAASLFGSKEVGLPDMATIVRWEVFLPNAGIILLAGALLCGLAAWISASIYLRKDYDSLFK